MKGRLMRPDMMYPPNYQWVRGLFALVIVLAIIAGAVLIVRMLVNRPQGTAAPASTAAPAPSGESVTPLQILEMRFARGEIDEQEFRTRRDVLRS